MIRNPAVAGQFYPGNPQTLEREVASFVKEGKREDVLGVISPHAGYIYSGKVAGSVYSRIKITRDVIIIGPNHYGLGPAAACMSSGRWTMPNGDVEINGPLAEAMIKGSKYLKDDYFAHMREHSLEVQVPFLQYLKKDLRIVPVSMMGVGIDVCRDVGRSIARAVKEYGDKVMIVASSDMTHYESDSSARKKDKKAIEKVLALDPEGLLDTVSDFNISMCGAVPAAVMLIACLELGANEAELVDYATSAETSGDYDHVVGYAGMIIR